MKAQIDIEYPIFVRIRKMKREYEPSEKSAYPTRNRFFCNAIGRTKMLFKTKVEAERFIAYNRDNYENPEFTPCRAYKCCCCDGWHLTHYAHIPRRKEDIEHSIITKCKSMGNKHYAKHA